MSDIEVLEREIDALRRQLNEKQRELSALRSAARVQQSPAIGSTEKLSNDEIERYARQIILPEIGVRGQLALKNASVLIIGAGGLGCPSALYLCGAGVGHIGIVDYDTVEINNLHRQLLHTEHAVGLPKSHSAKNQLHQLNSSINVSIYHVQLSSRNALELIKNYDIVLDASDNVATRYLLNDVCVMLKKPLVSGSALQLEGQLTVYNYRNGPCYRCLFPKPPPPETVTNCGDGGVIGALTGVIGALQALEAIKIVLNIENTLSGRLLLFDAARTIFRNVRLRGKQETCAICSEHPTITELIDYEQFCGMKACDKDAHLNILATDQRVTVQELQKIRAEKLEHLLIDVRTENEFEICQLEAAENWPIKLFADQNDRERNLVERIGQERVPVYVICRRGNDSQIAAKRLIDDLRAQNIDISVKDVIGGLHAWTKQIDDQFPIY